MCKRINTGEFSYIGNNDVQISFFFPFFFFLNSHLRKRDIRVYDIKYINNFQYCYAISMTYKSFKTLFEIIDYDILGKKTLIVIETQ